MIKATLFASIALVLVASATSAYGDDCSKFADDVSPVGRTQACQKAIKELPYEVRGLNQCYRSTGLYFSNPEIVCSPNCLEPTIKAAKKLADACQVSAAERESVTSSTVYETWSNKDAAEISCRKNKEGNYCISMFSSLAVQAANYELSQKDPGYAEKYDLVGKDWKKEFDCDGPCARPLYEALNGHGELAPTLYFYVYDGLFPVFKAIESICELKPKVEDGKDCDDAAPATPKY